IKERGASRVDAAGNAGQSGGNGMDPKLGRECIHAKIGRRILILLDSAERQAELTVGDHGGNQHRYRHSRNRGIVMLILAESLVFRDAITARSASDIKIV